MRVPYRASACKVQVGASAGVELRNLLEERFRSIWIWDGRVPCTFQRAKDISFYRSNIDKRTSSQRVDQRLNLK